MVIVFFLNQKHCTGPKDLHPHRPKRLAAPGGADHVDVRSQKRDPDAQTLLLASHFSIWVRNANYNNILLFWQHAKWAVTDANLRARATMQIVKYLDGRIPRLPDTAVEVYGKMVNQVGSSRRKALSV